MNNFQSRYYSANMFFKQKFGEKIMKISIDAGFTCPNRDGNLSYKGCIFCSEKGSGDFAAKRQLSIKQQIQSQKNMLSSKWNCKKYMVYFQAFTNTYAPLEVLKNKYNDAIKNEGVVALSIATRPDCLNEDIVKLLSEINKNIYVCVELGFQTSNEDTAKLINRCYKNKVFEQAVTLLNKYNIDVICHIIFGLPYENYDDMIKTIKYVSSFKISGVKLQLLHILKNTQLETMYKNEKFKVLSLEEYVKVVVDAIEILPKNIVIHRLTGDGDKNLLIAPLWSKNKKLVLNSINKELKNRDSFQGKFYNIK